MAYNPYMASAPTSSQQFYASEYGGYNVGTMGSMSSSASEQAYGDMTGQRLSTGVLAAFGTSGYPGEPALLEELGVNFEHIVHKTKAALNPFGAISHHIMDDADLAGPLLFFLLFAVSLLLNGKAHFGYVYGFGLVGTCAQWAVLNLMALSYIDFTRTMSVLGYCLLPLVATAFLGIVVSLNNILGYVLGLSAVAWCTYSSSGFFVSYLQLSQMRALVAYPLALFYGIFTLMTLFADK